jgi:hypothetical protein
MRYHILAIIAIFSLLLSGCAQSPPPVAVDEPPAPSAVPSVNNTAAAAPCTGGNIVQNDNCFSSLAREKSDSNHCKSIYAIDKYDACLMLFANSSLDICRQVANSNMRASCLTANAVREKSEVICNQIEDTAAAAACLKLVLPPCMLISDEGERSLCIALGKGDFSLCKGDACLAAYAMNRSDQIACGAIIGQNERYYCLALVKKSVASCKEAPLVPVQDSCIEKAAFALGDLSGCSLASGLYTDDNPYRNRCYASFAVGRLNYTICQKVEPESSRDECYKNYSASTATTDACPKVVESTNKVDCYFKAAKINRKPSLCNPLWTTDFKNTCYAGAILYPSEGPVPEDCQSVSSAEWKDKCFYQSARAAYNGTYCSFITPGLERNNCEKLFS